MIESFLVQALDLLKLPNWSKLCDLLVFQIFLFYERHYFAKHFHRKHFNFSTILLSCWNKKFLPLHTILIKWKGSLLKYIYSSIYMLNEDLIFGYYQHFYQGGKLFLTNCNYILIEVIDKRKLVKCNTLMSENQASLSNILTIK